MGLYTGLSKHQESMHLVKSRLCLTPVVRGALRYKIHSISEGAFVCGLTAAGVPSYTRSLGLVAVSLLAAAYLS